MPIELWLAFVAASAALLVLPGTTILTVISCSLAHGRRAQLPLVAAVALGDCAAPVLSQEGLGALPATSAVWFTVVKVAGGPYLLYLGPKLLRAAVSAAPAQAAPAAPGSDQARCRSACQPLPCTCAGEARAAATIAPR